MTLLAAMSSAAGTLSCAAAAAISISRAMAPPSRTYCWLSRMPRLPPVEKFFQTRLRATFSPGVGYSQATLFQSHSSSSATSWQRPVSVPCPISERAMRITTLSSGWMTTQAFSSLTVWACAAPSSKGTWKPSEKPPATAAPLTRKPLRRREGRRREV